jgi:hypothetical protein
MDCSSSGQGQGRRGPVNTKYDKRYDIGRISLRTDAVGPIGHWAGGVDTPRVTARQGAGGRVLQAKEVGRGPSATRPSASLIFLRLDVAAKSLMSSLIPPALSR